MSDHLVRLNVADYEEAIAFLTLVFAKKHRVDEENPAVYYCDAKRLACNYAVRREGRIAAIVGVFPIQMQVGAATLKVAGIGGVSVHPEFRRAGLMRLLMDQAMADIRNGDYHAAFLTGQRQRYRYWGFERCSFTVQATIAPGNFRHEPAASAVPLIELHPLASSAPAATLDAMRCLHDAQPVHCERSAATFARHLGYRRSQSLIALAADAQVVGYMVVNSADHAIFEFVAPNPGVAMAMLRGFMERFNPEGGSFTLNLPALASPLLERLGPVAELFGATMNCNWDIYDWPRVVSAWLTMQSQCHSLPEGQVVLDMGESQNLLVAVRCGAGHCEWTRTPADFHIQPHQLKRLLFGPLPPRLVAPLPSSVAALLQAWCPLPMFLPRLDYV